ncbi:MAG: trigger factor, partial [Ruminococcaceae bacterium]|nr:trigger factor [Oscillospiraceae bacterium]
KQVKTRLALEKIAELEGVAATDEEVEAEFARLSEAYNMEVEKVKESIEADALAEDIKVKKAVDLIKEAAVIKKPAAKRKSPAKKAAPKKTEAEAEAEAEEAPAAEAPAETCEAEKTEE